MDQSHFSHSYPSCDPTCLQDDSYPTLTLHIYANLARNAEVLRGESLELRRTATLSQPTAIYIHHEKSRTKLVVLAAFPSPPIIDEEGYRLIAEIYPVIDEYGYTSFYVQRQDLGPADLSRPDENTFVCLRKEKEEERPELRDDDVIKMGRECYRVRIARKDELAIKPIWHEPIPQLLASEQASCRICLSQEMTHQRDYLISPCRCAGSCAYLHLECLRGWMGARMQVRTTKSVKTYNFRLFCCEICKQKLPRFVKIGREVLPLLPLTMKSKCVVLERVGENPLLHLVDIKEGGEQMIGRNDKLEFYLQEMSISRSHAKLVFNQTRVEIEDCESKFGTFLLLRRRLPLRRVVSLYCGRWMLRISPDSD